MKKHIRLFVRLSTCLLALISSLLFLFWQFNRPTPQEIRILLDPGHGGALSKDQGAVAYDGTKEYTLNDKLVMLTYYQLKQRGYQVSFTRHPYLEEQEFTLSQRTAIINAVHPDLFISFHHDAAGRRNKNSRGYTLYYSSYKYNLDSDGIYVLLNGKKYPFIGEQIVDGVTHNYYKDGKTQKELVGRQRQYYVRDTSPCKEAGKSRKFAGKLSREFAGLSYLSPLSSSPEAPVIDNEFRLLRMSNVPSVLIEAGFLTNREELDQIKKIANQEEMAKAVVKAIDKYFHTKQ